MQKDFFHLEPFNLNCSKFCRTNIVQNGGDHIKMKRHFKGGIVQILGNIFAIVFVESWNSQIHDMPFYQNFLCTIFSQNFSLDNIVTKNAKKRRSEVREQVSNNSFPPNFFPLNKSLPFRPKYSLLQKLRSLYNIVTRAGVWKRANQYLGSGGTFNSFLLNQQGTARLMMRFSFKGSI